MLQKQQQDIHKQQDELEHINLDYIRRAVEDSSWADYRSHTKDYIPLKESIISLSKSSIICIIYYEIHKEGHSQSFAVIAICSCRSSEPHLQRSSYNNNKDEKKNKELVRRKEGTILPKKYRLVDCFTLLAPSTSSNVTNP